MRDDQPLVSLAIYNHLTLTQSHQYQNQALNLQRLGELRGHLGQQQGFGLQAQDMGQRFNLGMLGAANARQGNLANLLGGMGQQGLGNRFDTINRPGQAAGAQDFGVNLIRQILAGQ